MASSEEASAKKSSTSGERVTINIPLNCKRKWQEITQLPERKKYRYSVCRALKAQKTSPQEFNQAWKDYKNQCEDIPHSPSESFTYRMRKRIVSSQEAVQCEGNFPSLYTTSCELTILFLIIRGIITASKLPLPLQGGVQGVCKCALLLALLLANVRTTCLHY